MDRNLFSLNHRRLEINNNPPANAPEEASVNERVAAFLLAQGDNRNVEDLIRTWQQNIVVDVNLSYYFKIMLLMLSVNTLLLFKWIVFDKFPGLGESLYGLCS